MPPGLPTHAAPVRCSERRARAAGGRPVTFEFLKDMYVFELEERHREDGRVVSLVTYLAFIAGAIAFVLRGWEPRAGLVTWLVLVTLGVILLFFVACIACLIRAQVGRLYYQSIPYLNEFARLREELRRYAEANPTVGFDPEAELQAQLESRLITATTVNTGNNMRRRSLVHRASTLIAWMTAGAVLASLLGFVDTVLRSCGVRL